MTTVADKLALIYDTKSKIRDAVNLKGGAILETTAFTEYPEAILDLPVALPGTAGHKWEKNPTWWDIKTIIENDNTEGYRAIYARLDYAADAITPINFADIFDAVRTSDGAFYTKTASHVWDTTKDKESNEFYKTRYLIYYVKNESKWLHGDYFYLKNPTESRNYYLSANSYYTIGLVFNINLLAHGSFYTRPLQPAEPYERITFIGVVLTSQSNIFSSMRFIEMTFDNKFYLGAAGSFRNLAPFCKQVPPIYHLFLFPPLVGQTFTRNSDTLDDIFVSFPNVDTLEWHWPNITFVTKEYKNSNKAFTLGDPYTTRLGRITQIYFDESILKAMDLNIHTSYDSVAFPAQPEMAFNNRYFILEVPNGNNLVDIGCTSLSIIDTENVGIFFRSLVNTSQSPLMPISNIRKLISILKDRNGLSSGNFYINQRQNTTLSTTDKLNISSKNWTINVTTF